MRLNGIRIAAAGLLCGAVVAFSLADASGSGPSPVDLLFVAGGDLYLGNVGSSSPTRVGPGSDGAWASDGSRIVFVRNYARGSDLVAVDADGLNERRVTEDASTENGAYGKTSPVWSPDGTRIAYLMRYVVPNGRSASNNVWLVAADGSGKKRLTSVGSEGEVVGRLLWSAAEDVILFQTTGASGTLQAIDAEGVERPLAALPRTAGFPFALSPDGRSVAVVTYTSGSFPGGGDVYVVPLDGSAARRVSQVVALGSGVRWSADGRTLTYWGISKPGVGERSTRIGTVFDRNPRFDLYRVDLATLTERRLTGPPDETWSTSSGVPNELSSFWPDGTRLLDNRGLIANADGSCPTPWYFGTLLPTQARWRPGATPPSLPSLRCADLAMEMTGRFAVGGAAGTQTVSQGTTNSFSFQLWNLGSDPATNLRLHLEMQDAYVPVAATLVSLQPGSCARQPLPADCRLDDIPPGTHVSGTVRLRIASYGSTGVRVKLSYTGQDATQSTTTGWWGVDVTCAPGGTPGGDHLTGTRRADLICGLAGNDTINGRKGDDYLNGGNGRDTITGGPGRDFIDGDPGQDTINGGQGDDYLDGGYGPDRITGGLGRDDIVGGPGQDTIFGGQGRDTIRARDGQRDTINCGFDTNKSTDIAFIDRMDTLRGCEVVKRP